MKSPKSEERNVGSECNRRLFLIRSGVALGAGAVALALGQRAIAADPLLSPSDPAAQKMHYTDDASKVDRGSNPTYTAGSKCATCSMYRGGSSATGGCALFPGKSVSANGWCLGYAQQQDAE
jgi:hypothetical protein